MTSPLDHGHALLARARDDFYVVRHLRGEADAPRWVIGFHAQQAVEKALKAVLSSHGIEYPRTHNLVMLVEMLRRARIGLPPDADTVGLLVPFGVLLRYEDVEGAEPPHIDPEGFEALVARTLDWAMENLKKED